MPMSPAVLNFMLCALPSVGNQSIIRVHFNVTLCDLVLRLAGQFFAQFQLAVRFLPHSDSSKCFLLFLISQAHFHKLEN
jgi:hypothetical protein